MKNPFRRFMEISERQEPLSNPKSISYGKAVQFSAEAIARNKDLKLPKKKHYREADNEISKLTESDIEAMALFKKLEELVGLEQASELLDAIQETTDRAKEFVKKTASEELRERLTGVIASIRRDNLVLSREIVTNAFKESASLYELEVGTKVEDFFEELKSQISYGESLHNKNDIETACNEMMSYFAKLAVKDGVATYKHNLKNYITEQLRIAGRIISPEDLEDF